ncbi:dTDP-glucose 4,6-dehydratase [Embleya sp. NBC_00888]|uniref:dTDP-glucose 4,6-dehydratase n=1 Tax=Embleya sp. NBC_00888 TaxID=2975960 RepID=UPI002F913231
MRLMVTGGAGFIGSNFVHYWSQQRPNDTIVVYDKLTYAGNPANLAGLDVELLVGDITDTEHLAESMRAARVDCVINFAAESDNSRAVRDPRPFALTNVLGTQSLCEAARLSDVPRVHHVSTCEVFGDLALDDPSTFSEDSPYRPNTPYAASKAGADHFVLAYARTFGLGVTVSRSANNYGPRQYPEKNPPLFIVNALRGRKLPVYTNHWHRREWMSVVDHCAALRTILLEGTPGRTYNIGTGDERSAMDMALFVLEALGLDRDRHIEIVADRAGHDRRYLLDSSALRSELGWAPHTTFREGMAATVRWYRDNPEWWEPLVSR